jgi:hypothetical protein
VLAKAGELVRLVRQYGYRRELIQIIDSLP